MNERKKQIERKRKKERKKAGVREKWFKLIKSEKTNINDK